MRLRDQVQHHVERGGAARTGDTGAVDLEQVIGDVELGEFLGQPVDILPVDGAAPAFEKTCGRHHIGAGADRADHRTVAVEPADQVQDVAVGVLAHIHPRADKHHAAVLQHRGVAVGGHFDPVAGDGRLATGAGNDPFIQLAVALPVGRAQGFDRRCESQHREIVQQQKSDFLRRGAVIMLKQ